MVSTDPKALAHLDCQRILLPDQLLGVHTHTLTERFAVLSSRWVGKQHRVSNEGVKRPNGGACLQRKELSRRSPLGQQRSCFCLSCSSVPRCSRLRHVSVAAVVHQDARQCTDLRLLAQQQLMI